MLNLNTYVKHVLHSSYLEALVWKQLSDVFMTLYVRGNSFADVPLPNTNPSKSVTLKLGRKLGKIEIVSSPAEDCIYLIDSNGTKHNVGNESETVTQALYLAAAKAVTGNDLEPHVYNGDAIEYLATALLGVKSMDEVTSHLQDTIMPKVSYDNLIINMLALNNGRNTKALDAMMRDTLEAELTRETQVLSSYADHSLEGMLARLKESMEEWKEKRSDNGIPLSYIIAYLES